MLTATRTQENRLIDDLAADLTEPALAILAGTDVHGDSVTMELGLWHALSGGLECERRFRRMAGIGRPYSPEGVIEEVVHRAVLAVAATFGYAPDAAVRPLASRMRVTGRQRAMVAKLFAEVPDGTPRPLGRSGVVRQLTVTALN